MLTYVSFWPHIRIASCVVSNRIVIRKYDTIRDAIVTCARKPTWVGLIYRTVGCDARRADLMFARCHSRRNGREWRPCWQRRRCCWRRRGTWSVAQRCSPAVPPTTSGRWWRPCWPFVVMAWSAAGPSRQPGMTSTNGASPRIGGWREIVVRANLIQPRASWATPENVSNYDQAKQRLRWYRSYDWR